jgi:hypothetical protein
MATPLGAMVYRWHVKLCDEMAANATPIGLIFDLLNRHPGLSTKQIEELAKSLLVDGEVLEELFLHPESKLDMQLMEDEKTAIETICDADEHSFSSSYYCINFGRDRSIMDHTIWINCTVVALYAIARRNLELLSRTIYCCRWSSLYSERAGKPAERGLAPYYIWLFCHGLKGRCSGCKI